jgi:hypothetical protein
MIKVGQEVHLLRDAIPTHPVMTITQIDEQAGKAQIRFQRPNREAYSYYFWRDLKDVISLEEATHGTPTAPYTRPDPAAR